MQLSLTEDEKRCIVFTVLRISVFERFDADCENAAETVEWIRSVWRTVWRVFEKVSFLKRIRVDGASISILLGVRVHLGSAREDLLKSPR